ncbi:hypothetical protein IQ260_24335 [Leptolyngbya cf. ectocarpi LEGE 11479]|uniref:Uncharacterized protein n=1 Tax=Leptolyngbya cf. ectocarpi LEGE 11479 TaxID=1828722 RepID=A0A928ZYI0_LEPEC|nr:hypothetical protein [Leptolyngbya ectocarpi]MBE9069775.1 hypothetical protein [Leptolyngbya cf. ectocarpi LEGE 11479]
MSIPENLFGMVLEIDKELINQGINPHVRYALASDEVLKRLYPNSPYITPDDSISDAIRQIYNQIYSLRDLQSPSVHVGAVIFRDIFFPLRIPVDFGYNPVNPVNLLEGITETQKQIFFSDKTESRRFFDQFIDLMDFAHGLHELQELISIPARTLEWWTMARQQLEAAAATGRTHTYLNN